MPTEVHWPVAWLDGMRVDGIDAGELTRLVEQRIERGERLTLAYANPNTASLRRRDGRLAAALQAADVVYCDSRGMQLCCWLAAEPVPPHVTYVFWIEQLARMLARRGSKLFLLGSTLEVLQRATSCLRRRVAGLDVCGTHHGYFSNAESSAVIAQINRSGADMLIVGMGTPRQEVWLHRHCNELAPTVLSSGGAFLEWLAAPERHAPPWATRLALAWMWRLKDDPARLWHRYLVDTPLFLQRVLQQRWRRSAPRAGIHGER